MRVLLVDDSKLMRQLHREVLLSFGDLDVVEAEDGVRAVETMQEYGFKFDLILLDWAMPRIDGLTLAREIKAVPSLAEIPIFLVASSSDEQRLQEAWGDAADGYLLKPFTGQLFAYALLSLQPRLIGSAGPDASPPSPPTESPPAFLETLGEEMRRRVLDMSFVVQLEAEEVLLRQGESPTNFYFVARGEIDRRGPAPRSYRKGDCFALTEVITGDPVDADFVAKVASTVGRVPKAAFESMMGRYPELSRTLASYLASEVRGASGVSTEHDPLSESQLTALLAHLQTLHLRQTTCTIALPGEDAELAMVCGQIVGARCGDLEGEEAFFAIAEKGTCNREVRFDTPSLPPSISKRTTQLLMETVQRETDPAQLI